MFPRGWGLFVFMIEALRCENDAEKGCGHRFKSVKFACARKGNFFAEAHDTFLLPVRNGAYD